MAEIKYGAAGSLLDSDEENDIIEAYIVEDELNDCNFADKIHPWEHCREDPCVWIINSSHVEEWADRQLEYVPSFMMGFTTLVVRERLTELEEVFPLCGQACLGLSWQELLQRTPWGVSKLASVPCIPIKRKKA
jgi:hypothetical protein